MSFRLACVHSEARDSRRWKESLEMGLLSLESAAPSGALLAAALDEGDQAISAMVRRRKNRCKTVVPGRDIIGGRHPEAYGDLFSPPEEAFP